jgi:hypothetical protein
MGISSRRYTEIGLFQIFDTGPNTENKDPTDAESSPPPQHIYMSVHPEGNSLSDIGASAWLE